MLKEIREVLDVIDKYKSRKDFDEIKEKILEFNPASIIIASRGTSDNAAVFGKYVLESIFKIPVSFASFSLYLWYRSFPFLKNVLGVGISQSGETVDVVKVIETFNREGSLTLGITNESDSTLAKISKISFLLEAGKEHSVAATKTYSSTLLFFLGLANNLNGISDFDSIKESVNNVIEKSNDIQKLVTRYRFAESFIILGRGFNYPNALEFALKLRETCLVNAVGYSTVDFLHGPIASLTPETPVILLMPHDETFESNLEVLKTLISYNADVLVVSDFQDLPSNVFHFYIKEGKTLEYPVYIASFLQLFSFYLSIEKKLNPDKPEKLRKVTYGI
ncbi:putative glucosamine-6-phosphate deaminase [Caldisericum exile AZM16c01]|uniref:Glucosamine-6-phosphate deaminase n=2 Tax=Caldisericum exile TaxID=693075 RepID=A0A7U6GDJ3_CALEA|nr:putative glucosamine-6-phosphate deaminase [Caldisericum exile AZM16c01]